MHALAKDIGEGSNVYGLGEGVSFRAFCRKHLQGKLVLKMERVDKGTRQDSVTRSGLVAYWNRIYYVDYLYPFVASTSSSANLLQKNLYVMLTSPPVVACLRARAIMHDKVTTHLMFFSASETLDWSILDFAPVIEAMVVACKVSPERFLEATYNPFAVFVETVPAYAKHLIDVANTTAYTMGANGCEAYQEYRRDSCRNLFPDRCNQSEVPAGYILLLVSQHGRLGCLTRLSMAKAVVTSVMVTEQ
jgi:hypothetical protein